MTKPLKKSDHYLFHFSGLKVFTYDDGFCESYKNWSNRNYGETSLVIHIPSIIGEVKKLKEMFYKKGIVTYIYELVMDDGNSSSD